MGLPAWFPKAVNLVLFQAGWLACVLLTNWLGIMIAAAVLVIHLAWISPRPWVEGRFIVLGTVLGCLLDGLWFRTGVLQGSEESLWIPLWLVAIWALFLTTLAHSLAWMHSRIWLPFVLAPFAGPLAYYTAARLGAIELATPTLSLLLLAVGWAALFPLLMWIQRRWFAEVLV